MSGSGRTPIYGPEPWTNRSAAVGSDWDLWFAVMHSGCRTPTVLSWAAVRTIQIRNVPDAVHATLRTRAAAAGVSLSDYALAELERIAERPAVSDVLRRAGSRAGGAATIDIVAAVRAGRDRD